MKKIFKNLKLICILTVILSIYMTVFSNLCFASDLDLISFIMFLMFMGMAAFPYIIIASLFIFGFRIAFDTMQQAALDVKKENQNNRLLEQRNKKYVTVGENIRKNLKEVPTEEKIEGLSVEERHEKYGNDISKYIISHNARKEMTVKKVKPKINPYASEYYEDVIFR